jgi:hypothetical protein
MVLIEAQEYIIYSITALYLLGLILLANKIVLTCASGLDFLEVQSDSLKT